MNNLIAIVIPAFKAEYLEEALTSLVNQTNKNFRVYIGDDSGPLRISEIISYFTNRLDIVYRRFDDNLGLNNLVGQWERCISLTNEEEYIWLFSDDDLAPGNSVERLFDAIKNYPECDLFRFNIRQIDEKGNYLSEVTEHPEIESSEAFLRRRLTGETLSAACEYIFRKDTFLRSGGFVNFPMAWCSDDATWSLIGRRNGIVTLKGDPVLWRISGINISRPGYKKRVKFISTILYYNWLKKSSEMPEIRQFLPTGLRRQILILDIGILLFTIYLVRILSAIGVTETIRTGFVLFRSKLMKQTH